MSPPSFTSARNPLVVVDLGGPVADVAWAPYSSTVVVAATDEGKVTHKIS